MKIGKNRYFTISEVSQMLGVGTSWLRQLCLQGRVQGAYKTDVGWIFEPGFKLLEHPNGSKRPYRLKMHVGA